MHNRTIAALLGCTMLIAGCTVKLPSNTAQTDPGSSPPPGDNSSVPAQAEELEADNATDSTLHQELSEADLNSNQHLLDSALVFCQTSNDFWEQGDLDNALDALDKAYSLILELGPDAGQDLLQQKEDLRFTVAKRIMEVYASRFNVVNGYQKAIPLDMNEYVRKALSGFQGKEKRFFLNAYVRSGRYRPAIVRALKEEGLPEELSWLPLIESGFKVRALSKARALGLWQFIASTGYKFGLARNAWIDERMDPEKSTMAAIAYLKELHGIFGDWTTALAAYNCGEGNVLRAIKRQRINYLDNFWDLFNRLPYETASYVPRFMAVLHILNDPEKYGFSLPEAEAEAPVETVAMNKQVHLKTIANHIDIPYDDLKALNPELRNNVTPPSPYSLKVPRGKAPELLVKLNDIPIWAPPVPAYVVHRVREGESLSVIAKKYHTSVKGIMAMNNLKRSSFIRTGWKLKIPTGRTVAARRMRPPLRSSRLQGSLSEYTVRKGDSLWEIAKRFQTTTKDIQSVNQLKNTRLSIGQMLLIPTKTTSMDTLSTSKYKVREGDSPYLIARRHRMKLADFLRLNRLTPRTTIFPGQTLLVRAE